jgi:hypothetical protein
VLGVELGRERKTPGLTSRAGLRFRAAAREIVGHIMAVTPVFRPWRSRLAGLKR